MLLGGRPRLGVQLGLGERPRGRSSKLDGRRVALLRSDVFEALPFVAFAGQAFSALTITFAAVRAADRGLDLALAVLARRVGQDRLVLLRRLRQRPPHRVRERPQASHRLRVRRPQVGPWGVVGSQRRRRHLRPDDRGGPRVEATAGWRELVAHVGAEGIRAPVGDRVGERLAQHVPAVLHSLGWRSLRRRHGAFLARARVLRVLDSQRRLLFLLLLLLLLLRRRSNLRLVVRAEDDGVVVVGLLRDAQLAVQLRQKICSRLVSAAAPLGRSSARAVHSLGLKRLCGSCAPKRSVLHFGIFWRGGGSWNEQLVCERKEDRLPVLVVHLVRVLFSFGRICATLSAATRRNLDGVVRDATRRASSERLRLR